MIVYKDNSITSVNSTLKEAIDKRIALFKDVEGIHIMHTEREINRLMIEIDILLMEKGEGRWRYTGQWAECKKFKGVLITKWNGDKPLPYKVLIISAIYGSRERIIKYMNSSAFKRKPPIFTPMVKAKQTTFILTNELPKPY